MSLNNTISEYGLVAKLFHWISFFILIIQIPLGFRILFSKFRFFRHKNYIRGISCHIWNYNILFNNFEIIL